MSHSIIYPQVEVDPRDLQQNPWNPNEVDPINREKIRNSLRSEGFFKPVLVRTLPDGVLQIIGGAHRVEEAIALGMGKVPATNLGVISDVRAKRITLLDNGRYGEDNHEKLSQLLSEGIGTIEDLLAILPIDEAELTGYFDHDNDLQKELDSLGDLSDDDFEGGEIDLDIKNKPTKTHEILRFKVSVDDAERAKEVINRITREQGFTESDALTNAGDAFVWLLKTAD
jgi:ParB-like chromosome segregation protein Spo0J